VFNHCDVTGQLIKQSNSVKKTQNKGYYTAQGHSRSSKSLSIESPYATFY